MVCAGTKAAGNLRIGSAGELEVVTQLQLGISSFFVLESNCQIRLATL